MRALVFLLFVLVVLGFSSEAVDGPQARTRPALRLLQNTPLKVQGSHFRPDERVRVKAGLRTARVTAGSRGSFVITIRGTSRCDTIRIVAIGSGGSHAVLKTLPPPMCMPARSH